MDAYGTLLDTLEALKGENRGRFDYVLERSKVNDTRTALANIGRSKSWFYGFPEEERERLDKLAEQLHYEKKVQAVLTLEDAVQEAAQVKVEGLRSRDQKIKQAASTEILDRVVGKTKEKKEVEHTIKFDGLLEFLAKVYGDDDEQE